MTVVGAHHPRAVAFPGTLVTAFRHAGLDALSVIAHLAVRASPAGNKSPAPVLDGSANMTAAHAGIRHAGSEVRPGVLFGARYHAAGNGQRRQQ